MKRKKHSPEFKREAIELVRCPGASCRQIGQEICVAANLLSCWVRKAHPGVPTTALGLGHS